MNKARYRGMRGLVRHAEPGRSRSVVPPAIYIKGKTGFCKWCGEAVDEKHRRYWHTPCHHWYTVAAGQPAYWMGHRGDCSECGAKPAGWDGMGPEIDHQLAISVVKALGGRRALLRAFTPDNLRWLCHDCHVAKTRQDRRIVEILTLGISQSRDWAAPRRRSRPQPVRAGGLLPGWEDQLRGAGVPLRGHTRREH